MGPTYIPAKSQESWCLEELEYRELCAVDLTSQHSLGKQVIGNGRKPAHTVAESSVLSPPSTCCVHMLKSCCERSDSVDVDVARACKTGHPVPISNIVLCRASYSQIHKEPCLDVCNRNPVPVSYEMTRGVYIPANIMHVQPHTYTHTHTFKLTSAHYTLPKVAQRHRAPCMCRCARPAKGMLCV